MEGDTKETLPPNEGSTSPPAPKKDEAQEEESPSVNRSDSQVAAEYLSDLSDEELEELLKKRKAKKEAKQKEKEKQAKADLDNLGKDITDAVSEFVTAYEKKHGPHCREKYINETSFVVKCLVDYGYPNLKSKQKAPAAAAPPAQVEPRATRNSGKESGKDTKAAEPFKIQYVCPKCKAQHVEHQRKLCHSCREASDQQRTAKKQKTK